MKHIRLLNGDIINATLVDRFRAEPVSPTRYTITCSYRKTVPHHLVILETNSSTKAQEMLSAIWDFLVTPERPGLDLARDL